MDRLVLSCISFVVVISVFTQISVGQEDREAFENLQSFFEDYSKWQRNKREAGDDTDGNATLNLNWGYRQEETTYWASEEKTDFFSAFISCKQLGMEPVSVMTLGQNNQLEKFFKPLIKPEDDYPGFWMFARKIGDKDRFYWLNTGKPLAYTKWFANYPDNWGGDENCLSMLYSSSAGTGWNDVKCDKSLRYVCQKRKSSVAFILDINRGIY